MQNSNSQVMRNAEVYRDENGAKHVLRKYGNFRRGLSGTEELDCRSGFSRDGSPTK
jgi:hypothetical protein